jgi:integrase
VNGALTKPPSAEIVALVDRAAYYGKSTIADATRKQYGAHWKHFVRWAESMGLSTNPPDVPTVACYLAALADGAVEFHWHDRQGHPRSNKRPHKYGSIQHMYIGLIHEIRKAGHDWPAAIPAITKVMHGIRYRKGDTKKRVTPLEIDDLRACLAKTRERRFEDLAVVRDRAILSLGFFSAMRRAEIVALKVDDLEFTPEGLVITIRRSKRDPFALGDTIGIRPQKDPKICPIVLLQRYLELSELKAGPLFRRIDSRSDAIGDRALTPAVVAMIVKAACERAGLDPDRFAGHSLRAGFATTAADKGRTLTQIMRQGRWKDQRTAQTYIRPATVFRDNPTDGLGDEEPGK